MHFGIMYVCVLQVFIEATIGWLELQTVVNCVV